MRTEISQVYSVISKSNVTLLILALALSFIAFIFDVLKWKVILASYKLKMGIAKLYKLRLIGAAVNLFFPGFLAGDITRGFLLAKHNKKTNDSMATIFVDRILSIMILLGLSSVIGLTLYAKMPKTFLLAPLFFFVLGTLVIMFRNYIIDIIQKINKKIKSKLIKKLIKLLQAISSVRFNSKSFLIIIIFTLLFQSLLALTVYVINLSIGQTVSIMIFLYLVPMINIIKAIPISIAGIGVQENLYVLFLGLYGVGIDAALSISLLFLATTIIQGLVGGILYLTNHPAKE